MKERGVRIGDVCCVLSDQRKRVKQTRIGMIEHLPETVCIEIVHADAENSIATADATTILDVLLAERVMLFCYVTNDVNEVNDEGGAEEKTSNTNVLLTML